MKSGFLTVNKLITVKILTKTSTFNSGAINDMFGIPALLFLPGLIFTVLFLFVLQLQKISWVIEISYKEPIFWIMAVPISICITFFYSVCGNAHSSTDYEIRDIMWLWIVSVILAVIMGIGYGVVHQNFYVKKHRFHDKDSALDVINKIWSKYKTLELDFIKLKGQTEDEEWILLEKNQDGLSVVCQTIFVKTSSKITQGEADKILKELDGKEKEQVKIINKKRKNIELYWGVGSREKILFVDPIQIIETGTRASVLNME